MRQRPILLLTLLILLLASACQPATPITPAPSVTPSGSGLAGTPSDAAAGTPSNNVAATASPTPSAPTATPTAVPVSLVKPQYNLQIHLNYAQHSARVVETLQLQNQAGVAIPDVRLLVEPNRFYNAFVLGNILVNGTSAAVVDLTNNVLTIPLPQPLLPLETVDLRIEFELFLPAIPPPAETSKPQPFGYTARQLNLVDWYPSLPPYHPEQGWLAHPPAYFGEHQVYQSADFAVTLEIQDPPANLVVAASAPAQQTGSTYQYELSDARNFVFSLSPAYLTASRTVAGVTVTAYTFPGSERAGEAVLNDTANAVELYTRLFGPYAHTTLAAVEADFLDGMEYSGLYFLSNGFYNLYNGTPQGYLTIIAVHETAHQWWYNAVGNDQAYEPWLDEAMCTYTELLYYENVYPDLVPEWWSYRVTFYNPVGVINGAVYDYPGFTPYRNAVYLRGAQFLDAVRQRVGDEAFFAFLQDLYAQKSGSLVDQADFFELLAQHSTADISDLRAEYFQ